MSTPRWQQLDQIFIDARQLPREERNDFVTRASGADPGLCAEVLLLLEAEDESGEFMAKPALDRLAQEIGRTGWRLQPGERVGPHTIERLLGAGGAGEVWRARDERLGRHVAIKVMLPHVSNDAGRVRRFLDEARSAGALNHPNVLAIYDVGEHNGAPYIVSECLEGETLRKRLQKGPLPLEDAIRIALEIARGLAATHAQGIVHRDLKPDNVFLCSNGGVKILDFGVAKLRLLSADDVQVSPATMSGMILGTAGYMAPEQVRGERVDARADLFALGATLYEMLSGQRPFKGASTIETLHAILNTEAADLANGQVPTALVHIVKRLLQKNPDMRFQSAADLVWTLERVEGVAADAAGSTMRRRRGTTPMPARWFAWTAAAMGLAILVGLGWRFATQDAPQPAGIALTPFDWSLPAGFSLNSPPAVSPDGRSIVYAAWDEGTDESHWRLYLRKLDSLDLEPIAIPGTERAKQPFWSPDGKSVAFFARRKLMKVTLAGGAPVEIADARDGRGGAWSRSGVIVFSPDLMTELWKVSDAGDGRAEPITLLDLEKGENSHRYPVFLPDGVHFLYFGRSENEERRGTYLGRIDRPAAKPDAPLFQSESNAVFAPLPGRSGVLFYEANGSIELRPFDPDRLKFVGDPQTLAIKVGSQTKNNAMMLSASESALAFAQTWVTSGSRLASVDRTGKNVKFESAHEAWGWPRISPDGGRMAFQQIDALSGNPDLFVRNLESGALTRVTYAPEPDMTFAWSPDGNRLAHATGDPPGRKGKTILNISDTDGTGILQSFPCPGEYCEPTDWSHDGRLILNVRNPGPDVWIVGTKPGDSPQPLLAEPFSETDARISPDGQWIAYVSDESKRAEVSVRHISGKPRFVISPNGGNYPVWNRSARELFFVDPKGRLHSVSLNQLPNAPPKPVQLNTPVFGFGHWGTQYDVSPDGRQFYFLDTEVSAPELPNKIGVVLGWASLLK